MTLIFDQVQWPTLDPERLDYSNNGVREQVAITKIRRYELPDAPGSKVLVVSLDLPRPLASLDVGGSPRLYDTAIERIRSAKDETHRFELPFGIGGQDDVIDISFKPYLDTYLGNIVPGMP